MARKSSPKRVVSRSSKSYAVARSSPTTRKRRSPHAKVLPPREYVIFLSHSTIDKYIAIKMTEDIENETIRCFRDDKDIDSGDSITDEIINGIANADELIILLTPNSCKSDWVKLELGVALGHHKKVTAVRYIVDAAGIPNQLKDVKCPMLNDFDRVCSDIQKRAAKELAKK